MKKKELETWLPFARVELPVEIDRASWTLVGGPRRKPMTKTKFGTHGAASRRGGRLPRAEEDEVQPDGLPFVGKFWTLQDLVPRIEVILEGLDAGKAWFVLRDEILLGVKPQSRH